MNVRSLLLAICLLVPLHVLKNYSFDGSRTRYTFLYSFAT
jgi:hypothetical protein